MLNLGDFSYNIQYYIKMCFFKYLPAYELWSYLSNISKVSSCPLTPLQNKLSVESAPNFLSCPLTTPLFKSILHVAKIQK